MADWVEELWGEESAPATAITPDPDVIPVADWVDELWGDEPATSVPPVAPPLPPTVQPAPSVPPVATPVEALDPIAAEVNQMKGEEASRRKMYDDFAKSKGFNTYEEMRSSQQGWVGWAGEQASEARNYVGQHSIPFVSSGLELAQTTELLLAAKRYQDGKATPEDVSLLARTLVEREEQANRGWGRTVMDVVAGIPAFAGELLATGGVYSAGRGAAEKALGVTAREVAEGAAKRGVASKVAEFAATRGAGAAAQTAANPVGVAAAAARRMAPQMQQTVDENGNTVGVEVEDGEAFFNALLRGYGDQLIEVASERAGGVLGKGGNKVLGKISSKAAEFLPDRIPKSRAAISALKVKRALGEAYEAAQYNIIGRWLSKPGRTLAKLQSELREAGWNGVIGEVMEERAGDVGRLFTGLESFDENVTGQLAKAGFLTGKSGLQALGGDGKSAEESLDDAGKLAKEALYQLGVEGAAFAIPGVMAKAAEATAGYVDEKRRKKAEKEWEKRFREKLAEELNKIFSDEELKAAGINPEGGEYQPEQQPEAGVGSGSVSNPEGTVIANESEPVGENLPPTGSASGAGPTSTTPAPPAAPPTEGSSLPPLTQPEVVPQQPVELPATGKKPLGGEGSTSKSNAGTLIGKNADGDEIYEDANGVRHIVSGGIRRTEPVEIAPGANGVTARPSLPRRPEFEVASGQPQEPQPPVVQPPIAQPPIAQPPINEGETSVSAPEVAIPPESQSGDGEIQEPVLGSDGTQASGPLPPPTSETGEGPADQPTEVAEDDGSQAEPVTPKQRDYGTIDKPNRVSMGEHFAERLESGASYSSIDEARREAGGLLGGRVEPGSPAAKDVDEAVEQGVVRAARKIVEQGKNPSETFDALVELYSRQPTLGVRTSTSMLEQAYSTPAPLAYLAGNAIDVRPEDITYDPTAGNGMLLISSPVASARANELNTDRANALRGMGIETTENDAATWGRAGDQAPDKIIANPPFGAVKDEQGRNIQWVVDGVGTENIDHAIALKSLEGMPENGRAVLIIGSKGFAAGQPKEDLQRGKAYIPQKRFYDRLYDKYNVVDHYTVSGGLYRKQGAGFPVDVIVIDGLGASKRPKPYNVNGGGIPKVYNTWEELKNEKIQRGLESRPALLGNRGGGSGGSNVPGLAAPPSAPPGPSGADGGSSASGEGDRGGLPGPIRPLSQPGITGGHSSGGGLSGTSTRGPRGSGERLPNEGQADRPGGGIPGPTSGLGDDVQSTLVGPGVTGEQQGELSNQPESKPEDQPAETQGSEDQESEDQEGSERENGEQENKDREKKPKTDGDAETEFQVPYVPESNSESLGVLVPKVQEQAVRRALESIRDRYGDLDAFVAKELGYDDLRPYFSAEQVDALAMAIARHKENGAFIDGDQTGVGKGRVAAGMIVYAKRQGFVPVFVTKGPNLYADMVRDLQDIGQNTAEKPFQVLATNAMAKGSNDTTVTLPDGRVLKQSSEVARRLLNDAVDEFREHGVLRSKPTDGSEPVVYDAIFTTYDQLRPVAQSLKDRHLAINEIAGDAFLILDESHSAGGKAEAGDEDDSRQKLSTARFVRQLLDAARGAVFLSATYAKSPNVMDLYAKTGMAKAVSKASDLAAAIIAGKVPLQQVVSEMLAEAGAYMRRERSYHGVDFKPEVVDVGTKTADLLASIFNSINDFDVAKKKALRKIERDIVSGGGTIGKDDSTGERGLSSTNFSSILWNLVDQMLLSLKAEQVANRAVAAWKAGESPVIALDNTLESALDHYLEANPANVGDEIKFSYRDMLHRYLERSREIMVVEGRGRGATYTRIRLTDEQLGPKALALYSRAKQFIDDFDGDAPVSPIDKMRQVMEDAGMKVAEVTGRSKTLRYTKDGKAFLSERPKSEMGTSGKQKTISGFNDGTIDAIILNRSGSTGLSIHASKLFARKDGGEQRTRHMIIAQASKNIDEFMQMLGRIHRTGQIKLPKYTLLMGNIPAETRPATVLVKKLASLNANVTASASGSISFDMPDIFNEVGDRIVAEYLTENPDINDALGSLLRDTESTNSGIAQKASGRMAIMPVAEQKRFWETVSHAFVDEVAELERIGRNPLVASNVPLDARTLESSVIFDGDKSSSSPFEQPAFLEKILARQLGEPMTPDEIKAKLAGFYGEEYTEEVAGRWVKEQEERSAAAADAEYERRSAKLVDDDAKTRLRLSIAGNLSTVGDLLSRMKPGSVVRVAETLPDGGDLFTTGIVVNAKLRDPKRAAVPSAWAIEIAVPTADRMIRMPLSRITEAPGEPIRIHAIGRSFGERDLKNFEAPKSTYEERYVVTGNLLAGFSKVAGEGGNVVFFTDKNGNSRRGILLPRHFDPGAWKDSQPAVFKDSAHVLRFLSQGGDNAHSPDFSIQVSMDSGGDLVLRAPKSRQRSGKYTTNRQLLAAMGGDFISRGEVMVGRVPASQAVAALDVILEVGPLQTMMEKDLAERTSSAGGSQHAGPSSSGSTKADSMKAVYPESSSQKASNADAAKKPKILGKKGGGAGGGGSETKASRKPASAEKQADIAAQDIIETWRRIFGVPIRAGRLGVRGALGIYKKLERVVRMRESHYANLAVASHEIAHHVDTVTNTTGRILRDGSRVRTSDTQLPESLEKELGSLDYEPQESRTHEGWAEFLRIYVTGSHDSLSARAPGVFLWYKNKWSKDNPAWADKIEQAREHARNYANQDVFQRVRAQIVDIGGKPESDLSIAERFKADLDSRVSRMVRDHTDKFSMFDWIDREVRKLGKKFRASLRETVDAHYLAAPSRASRALKHGVTSIITGKKLSDIGGLERLADKLKSEGEYDEAIAYTYARFAKYLYDTLPKAKSGIRYNPGIAIDDALEILDRVSGDADKQRRLEEFATHLAKFNNDLLQMAAEAGATSREAYERSIAKYGDFYMPLHRAMEDGTFMGSKVGYVNLPNVIMGRSNEGSGRKIVDPVDATIMRALRFYEAAGKARVNHKMARMLDPKLGGVQGMGFLMERVPPKKISHKGWVKEILKTLVDEGIVEAEDAAAMKTAWLILNDGLDSVSKKAIQRFADRHGIDIDTDDEASLRDAAERLYQAALSEPNVMAEFNIWRKDNRPDPKNHIAVTYDANRREPILYQYHPELYDTIAGMDPIQFGFFTKIASSVGRYFKTGVVALSTAFGLSNLLRDYLEFQGRAKNVKGAESATKPIEMLGQYIAYKSRQAAGLPTNNAAIDLYEEFGGKMHSRISHEAAYNRRVRRRWFAKTWSSRFGLSLGHFGDTAEAALDTLQESMAISDAPPRLAEMLALAESEGYTVRGNDWYYNNKKVDYLPEWLRIRMAAAAANATTKFQKVGRKGQVINAWLPLYNPTLQGAVKKMEIAATAAKAAPALAKDAFGRVVPTYRFDSEAAIIAAGKAAGKSDKEIKLDLEDHAEAERTAIRLAIYMASLASLGAMYWMLRHDDPDWREQSADLRDGYWTFGYGSTTILRIPKPRDWAIVSNLTEGILDKIYHGDEARDISDVLESDVMSQLPTGGGLVRGGVEVFVADYDYFRQRGLTPHYLKDDPVEERYTPHTLESSKAISKYVGKYLGISPIQAQHLMNSGTGNFYGRNVGAAERLANGESRVSDIPFAGAVLINREQGGTVDRFYDELNKTSLSNKSMKAAYGNVDPKMKAKLSRLNAYAGLMADIRNVESKGVGGKRKFEYEKYIVGLARDAMGFEAYPDVYPNPIDSQDAPVAIKQIIKDFATRQAKLGVLSHDMPTVVSEGDSSYEESLNNWKERQKAAVSWLKEHKSSPLVQSALTEITNSKSYRDLLTMRDEPRFSSTNETLEEHQAEWNRWHQKAVHARNWLGDPD